MGPRSSPALCAAPDSVVAVRRPGDRGILAVLVRGGVAELGEAFCLRGTAERLFALGLQGSPQGLSPELAAADLLAHGALSAVQAEADARAFLAELERRRLSGAPAARAADGLEHAGVALEAPELEQLAREVLRTGHRLRYRAFGRSMRPSIPPGSLLEVDARPFAEVARGDVALYSAGEHRLVAHRIVGRRSGRLLARGDTCLRLDEVDPADYLGVVRARVDPGGRRVLLSTPWRRATGLASGLAWHGTAWMASKLVVRPLRASFGGPSPVRRLIRGALRASSGVLLAGERIARRMRSPLDVARAALLSAREKDEGRRRLYARRSVQSFTSLEENVASGLTLIEEVIFARHGLEPGRTLVLGCGPGRESMALARRGFAVTGLDREDRMLERARELARAASLEIRYLCQEARGFRLEGESFDYVVIFSGLYNMILPRRERVMLLENCKQHLAPGGRVLLTFLSAYRSPLDAPAPRAGGFWEAAYPEHEAGDLFLLNEAIHVFPSGEHLAEEARAAGFEVAALHRDQRAYDRSEGRVRGYAILRRGR